MQGGKLAGVLLSVGLFGASAAIAAPFLTSTNLGPVRVGMTLEQARKALGTPLHYKPDDPGHPECGHAQRPDAGGAGVHYMVEKGRITRIEVWPVDFDPVARLSAATTAKGVGLGATETQVKFAYGAALKVQAAPYNGEAHWLILDDQDKRHGIVFETSKGRVTSFWSGRYPSLTYSEGCL